MKINVTRLIIIFFSSRFFPLLCFTFFESYFREEKKQCWKKDPQNQRFTERQLEIMIRWIFFSVRVNSQNGIIHNCLMMVIMNYAYRQQHYTPNGSWRINDKQNRFLNCMKAKINKHKLARATLWEQRFGDGKCDLNIVLMCFCKSSSYLRLFIISN